MTKYAFVVSGIVRSTIDVPDGGSIHDVFHPSISSQHIECNEEVEIGWTYDEDRFINPNDPTYALSVIASGPINPGSSFKIHLETTKLEDEDTVPYTITGLEEGNLSVGTLTGNFVINSNASDIDLAISSDLVLETEQPFNITLDDLDHQLLLTIRQPEE